MGGRPPQRKPYPPGMEGAAATGKRDDMAGDRSSGSRERSPWSGVSQLIQYFKEREKEEKQRIDKEKKESKPASAGRKAKRMDMLGMLHLDTPARRSSDEPSADSPQQQASVSVGGSNTPASTTLSLLSSSPSASGTSGSRREYRRSPKENSNSGGSSGKSSRSGKSKAKKDKQHYGERDKERDKERTLSGTVLHISGPTLKSTSSSGAVLPVPVLSPRETHSSPRTPRGRGQSPRPHTPPSSPLPTIPILKCVPAPTDHEPASPQREISTLAPVSPTIAPQDSSASSLAPFSSTSVTEGLTERRHLHDAANLDQAQDCPKVVEYNDGVALRETSGALPPEAVITPLGVSMDAPNQAQHKQLRQEERCWGVIIHIRTPREPSGGEQSEKSNSSSTTTASPDDKDGHEELFHIAIGATTCRAALARRLREAIIACLPPGRLQRQFLSDD